MGHLAGNRLLLRLFSNPVDRRKLWSGLVGFGLGAATVAIVGAWPKAADGFEFLREQHPLEYRTQNPICDTTDRTPPYEATRPWYRVFRFQDGEKARTVLREHSPNPHARGDLFIVLPNGRRGNFYDSMKMLALYDESPPGWLQTQWLDLKKRMLK
jgi:hypothetical protein